MSDEHHIQLNDTKNRENEEVYKERRLGARIVGTTTKDARTDESFCWMQPNPPIAKTLG